MTTLLCARPCAACSNATARGFWAWPRPARTRWSRPYGCGPTSSCWTCAWAMSADSTSPTAWRNASPTSGARRSSWSPPTRRTSWPGGWRPARLCGSWRRRPCPSTRSADCWPHTLAGVEEGEHREHPPVVRVGLRQAQLGQDAVHVLFDGRLGDPQLVDDAGIGPALGHQREDLALARAELGERIAAPVGGEEPLHQKRVDHRSALGDAFERVDQLGHVGDPGLQQVADTV